MLVNYELARILAQQKANKLGRSVSIYYSGQNDSRCNGTMYCIAEDITQAEKAMYNSWYSVYFSTRIEPNE